MPIESRLGHLGVRPVAVRWSLGILAHAEEPVDRVVSGGGAGGARGLHLKLERRELAPQHLFVAAVAQRGGLTAGEPRVSARAPVVRLVHGKRGLERRERGHARRAVLPARARAAAAQQPRLPRAQALQRLLALTLSAGRGGSSGSGGGGGGCVAAAAAEQQHWEGGSSLDKQAVLSACVAAGTHWQPQPQPQSQQLSSSSSSNAAAAAAARLDLSGRAARRAAGQWAARRAAGPGPAAAPRGLLLVLGCAPHKHPPAAAGCRLAGRLVGAQGRPGIFAALPQEWRRSCATAAR
jgi:hypothetical protein